MTRAHRFLGAAALAWVLSCSAATPAPPGAAATAPRPAPPPSATAEAPRTTSAAVEAPAPLPRAPAPAPSRHAACEAPPVGMVCVPGGPAVIGADDHRPNERPRHTVEIGTFYLDRNEVTNARYEACEAAGACARRILPDKTFLGPDQPAVPISWHMAHAYCVWAGKRLPSEAEWEKVARGGPEGRVFPWGDEPATCGRAQTAGCEPNTTKPVASFPAGPYGVFDMAGNGYEWVNDWATPCYDGCPGACGADCAGDDPQGPCGGAPVCKGRDRHVLKGGSWRWAADEARGSWRRLEEPASGAHRLSFRCASTSPMLATAEPLHRTDPLPAPADPAPPSAAELEAFRRVVEDTDILKIKPCERGGGSRIDCRDPISYVTTNEPSQHVWLPYIENLGGGYVGIGADQSYSFIGAARSQWAWIFDYDPMVVRLHLVLRAVILASETPADFADAFSPARFDATRALVAEAAPPSGKDDLLRALLSLRPVLHAEYTRSLKPSTEAGRFGWLRNPEHYRYVRRLFQQGRIQALKGNLLTDKVMPSIAASAKALGVPVRIFYTSNADDQWRLVPQLRENVRALPFDERSILLRTVYPREKQRTGILPWEYTVQSGKDAQRRWAREGWDWVWYFAKEGRRGESDLVVTVGLPARTEREPAGREDASRLAGK